MDGTWRAAAAELGGELFPDEIRKSLKLVISDGKYTVTVGTQPDKGTQLFLVTYNREQP